MDIKRLQQLAGILKEDINPYEFNPFEEEVIKITDQDIYDIAYAIIKPAHEESVKEWEQNGRDGIPRMRLGPRVSSRYGEVVEALKDIIRGRVGEELKDTDLRDWFEDNIERIEDIINKVRNEIKPPRQRN